MAYREREHGWPLLVSIGALLIFATRHSADLHTVDQRIGYKFTVHHVEQSNMKFRFQQQTCRGLWTSPGVFEADYADIVRMVDNGHRIGQPRAAVDVVTHLVIYAVDGDGKAAEATWQHFAMQPLKAA